MDREQMRELARQITGLPVPRQQDNEEFADALHRLEAFHSEYARAPSAGADDAYEARLGSWVEAERIAHHRGILPTGRDERIGQVLGPDWADGWWPEAGTSQIEPSRE